MAMLFVGGCGTTLSQEGATDRLTNLLKYTSRTGLGEAYHADRYYEGTNPRTAIVQELDPDKH